jgi:protein TonB
MTRYVLALSALWASGVLLDAQQIVYSPADGVSLPSVLRSVPAPYPSEAMQRKIEGTARVEVTVLPDGSIDQSTVKLTRSLDRYFGLDHEALKAARKWQFTPGTKDGEPVAVRVWIDIAFHCACKSMSHSTSTPRSK